MRPLFLEAFKTRGESLHFKIVLLPLPLLAVVAEAVLQ
jgi:hypothetical protein